MPLLKTRTPIPQLSATGATASVSVAPSYRHSVYIRHANNGTGATSGAIVKVQARPQGSATWFDLLAMAFGVGTVAETRVVPLPDDSAEVRLDYTAPVGVAAPSLDAEVGQVTSY